MKYMARRRKRKIRIKAFWLIVPILLGIAIFVFYKSAIVQKQDLSGCRTLGYTGEFQYEEMMAYYDGEQVGVPKVADIGKSKVLGVANPEERWIEVDLSEQKLRAWDGSSLFLETPISTGLPWWPTPKGEFRIWIKMRFSKMEGGSGRYYYYLPNVPYVMYYSNAQVPSYRGYSLHGTYWHNAFGTQRSHGCVNLPTPIAERLFYWTTPVLTDGKWATWSSNSNPGTRIVIHE